MIKIEVPTKKRAELIDVTSKIESVLNKENISQGLCVVYCPHTTAALTINENADPCVKNDILNHLEELVPSDKNYTHLEGNSDGHIKASLLGFSRTIIVDKGKLVLGTWQGIYFCEFDGPRNRKIYLEIIKK